MHEVSAVALDGRWPPGLTATRGHMTLNHNTGKLHQLLVDTFSRPNGTKAQTEMLCLPFRPQSQSSQRNTGDGDGSLDNAEDRGPRRRTTMVGANISIHIPSRPR